MNMCKFMKALEERKGETYYNMPEFYRLFTPIEVKNGVWLSIQANGSCHCKPQAICPSLDDYTHWEMALFDGNEFIRVTDILPEFSSLAEIELYEKGTYTYVPTDLIEELYTALTA